MFTGTLLSELGIFQSSLKIGKKIMPIKLKLVAVYEQVAVSTNDHFLTQKRPSS